MIFTEIGDIAKILNGYAFKSTEYAVDGFQVIRITNVQAGYISNNNPKFIQLRNKSLEKFILSEGDLLISLTGNVGRVGKITKQNLPAVLNQRVGKIFIKSKEILPEYFFHILKSKNIELKIIEKAKGIAQKNISSSDLEKIQIPLPSINEQKKIVEMLDAAEALLQKRKEAIRLLDEYLNSVFIDMFGDPVKNTKKWEVKSLGSLLNSITSGSRGWAKYYSDEGSVFLTIKNVGRGNNLLLDNITYVNAPDNAEARRTKVKDGDILLSITADLGRTAVVPKLPFSAYINQHLAILRLKNGYNPIYISHYLGTHGGQTQIKKMNKGAAKAGLNFNDIKSIQIPVPQNDHQNKFADIVLQTEKVKQKMQEQAVELDNQFQSLMQQAFKN